MRAPDTGKPCTRCGGMLRFRRHRDRRCWIAIDYRPADRSRLTVGRKGHFVELVFRMTSEGDLVRATAHDYGNLWRSHRQTCRPEPDDRQVVIA